MNELRMNNEKQSVKNRGLDKLTFYTVIHFISI